MKYFGSPQGLTMQNSASTKCLMGSAVALFVFGLNCSGCKLEELRALLHLSELKYKILHFHDKANEQPLCECVCELP